MGRTVKETCEQLLCKIVSVFNQEIMSHKTEAKAVRGRENSKIDEAVASSVRS